MKTIKAWLSEPRHLKLVLWVAVFGPALLGVVVTATFFTYVFWPRGYDQLRPLSLAVATRHAVVIAHGVRDDPASWAEPLARAVDGEQGVQALAVDWSAYAKSLSRCAIDARRIGGRIGARLAASPTLSSVHLVGHSCGSFLVLGACETIGALRPELAVQTTYLAPVSVYGGMLWDYGVNRFGRCGSYSEVYIDTQDRTPGASAPHPHAYTFDVTALREPAGFAGSPHLWPVIYYARWRGAGEAPDLRKDTALRARYPSGAMERLGP